MKKMLSGAALAALMLWSSVPAVASGIDYTVVSAKTVDDALQALENLAQADGFKIPGVHTLPAPDEYIMVELCDPAEAKKLFAIDLKLGLLLPCGRIAVYKDGKDNGKTKISLLLPATNTKITAEPEVAKMAERLLPRFQKIVDQAK
jgi:uncharacterized protein (DUF302 family)